MRCDAGTCVPGACSLDLECALGLRCQDGACVTDTRADLDRDGVPDAVDSCPFTPNAAQEDADEDGIGNVCDGDDDNDGVPDTQDTCPLLASNDQRDYDDDGLGNPCDADWEGVLISGQLTSSLAGLDWARRATVTLIGPGGRTSLEVQSTGALSGRLRTLGLHALEINAEGHLPLTRVLSIEGGDQDLGTLVLTPEQSSQERSVVLRGNARLQGETLHAGIIVQARLDGALIASTLTDSAGDFALPLGRLSVTLRFSREHYANAEVEARWTPEADTFTLDGALAGEWTGVELLPNRSASLRGQLASSVNVRDWPATATVTLSGSNTSRNALITAGGAFELDQLQPGLYTLTVQARGHRNTSAALELAPDINDLSTLNLSPEFQPLIERLRLEGQPQHEGIAVSAYRDGALVDTAVTNGDGLFELNLLPDDHTLRISRPDFIPQELNLRWSSERDAFLDPDDQPLPQPSRCYASGACSSDSTCPTCPECAICPECAACLDDATLATLLLHPSGDSDRDGVLTSVDTCPNLYNPDQLDQDDDGLGDACDDDLDGDGAPNACAAPCVLDNCPLDYNPMQEVRPEALGVLDAPGVACDGGTLDRPDVLDGNLLRRSVSTRGRPDRLRGVCGGVDAGELVFSLTTVQGERIDVDLRAEHAAAIYMLELDGTPAYDPQHPLGETSSCTLSERFTWVAPATSRYLLVIDGAYSGAEGLLQVDIRRDLLWRPQPEPAYVFASQAIASAVLVDMDRDTYRDLIYIDSDYPVSSANRVRWQLGAPPCDTPPCPAPPPFSGDAGSVTLEAAPFALTTGDFYTGPGEDPGVDDLAVIIAPNLHAPLQRLLAEMRIDVWTSPIRQDTPGLTPQRALGANGPLWTLSDTLTSTQLFALLAYSNGQGPWPSDIEILIPLDSSSADLDDDGDDDLVIVMDHVRVASPPPHLAFDRLAGRVAVLLSDGEGRFNPAQWLDTGVFPTRSWLGHIDADPYPDLLVTNTLSAAVALYTGQGDGTLAQEAITLPAGYAPFGVAVGDLNADSIADLITPDAVSGELNITLGPIQDAQPQPALLGGSLRSVAVGDLNADGVSELVVGRELERDLLITDVRNNVLSTPERWLAPNIFGPRRLLIDDINRDGAQDILGTTDIRAELWAMLGTPRGRWTLANALDLGPNPAETDGSSLVAADFNQDGRLDLAVLDRATSTLNQRGALLVFFASPGGALTFEPPLILSVPPGAFNLAAVDFNHDGWTDLASTHVTQNLIVVAINQSGTFLPDLIEVENQQEYPSSITELDINRDGITDLFTTALANNPNLRWAAGRVGAVPRGCLAGQTGALPQQPTCDLGAPGCGFCAWGGNLNGYLSAATADWDDDGFDELVITQPRTHSVWLIDPETPNTPPATQPNNPFLICPGGTPSPTSVADCEGGCRSPSFVVTGDFDQDGDDDFVVTCKESDNLYLCENSGQHPYLQSSACVEIQGTSDAFALDAADLDQDGWIDLVASQLQPQAIAVLLNAPHPDDPARRTFRAAQGIPAAPLLGGLIAADLDNDGQQEIATLLREAGTLNIFTPAPNARLNTWPAGTRFGDADLPPCTSLDVPMSLDALGRLRADVTPDDACRIERLEITPDLAQEDTDGLDLLLSGPPMRFNFGPLRILPGERPLRPGHPSGRWRPQELPQLARLEGSPAPGRWELIAYPTACRDTTACAAATPLRGATLHINPHRAR